MKYQVQIKYTNPSHEHVSLRRRVESVTRLVEAANEQEAINRAANQQRALGFIIKEAEVYAPVTGLHSLALNNNEPQKGKEKKKELVGKDGEKTDIAASGGVKKEEKGGTESYPLLKKGEKLKPMKIGEGFDTDPKDIAAYLVDRHGKGKVTMDHIEAYERRRDSHRPIEKHEVMKHVKKMSEEVEQIDELSPATYTSAAQKARGQGTAYAAKATTQAGAAMYGSQQGKHEPNSPAAKMHAFAQKRFNQAGKFEKKAGLKPGGAGIHSYDPTPGDKGYSKGGPKSLTREEVESVDEAQKKLKPSYWRAEWRLGTQTEVDKNNKKIYDKLVKTDPEKAAKFHDNLMKIRKEEVEAVEEGADDWKKAFKKVAAKNYEKDIAAVRSSAHRLDKATRGFPAKPDTKPTDSNIDYIKQNVRKGVTKPHSMQEEVVSEAMPAYVKKGQEKFDAQARAQRATEKADKAQTGTLAAQKSRKAAERMVNRAKGNANKIDVAPTIEPGKPNLQR